MLGKFKFCIVTSQESCIGPASDQPETTKEVRLEAVHIVLDASDAVGDDDGTDTVDRTASKTLGEQ